MTRYIDIHAHLNFAAYDADRTEVVENLVKENVICINVGTQKDTSRSAVELAEKYPNLYATIGLHPVHTTKSHHDVAELGEGGQEFTSRGEVYDASNYVELARHPKVVAIGECGLDYYRNDPASVELQKKVFAEHIALANEVQKPLMLHIRSAYADAYEMLKSLAKVKGNVHFFAGNWEEAQKFLSLGFTLSFTGVITFADSYHEIIKNTPLDMIMSETDSPYVTPAPHRGKRNDPRYVSLVVKKIAEIKGLSEEEVATQILRNAERVFGIKV